MCVCDHNEDNIKIIKYNKNRTFKKKELFYIPTLRRNYNTYNKVFTCIFYEKKY